MTEFTSADHGIFATITRRTGMIVKNSERKTMIFRVWHYLVVLLFLQVTISGTSSYGQVSDVAEGLYRNAMSLLNQGLADKALDDFKRIVNNYPTSDFADDAYYLIGKYYYDQRDYPKSLEALNMVINSYGSHDRAPEAYYLKAMIFMDPLYDKRDYQDAYANFSRIYSIYHDSTWIDRGYYGAGMADYRMKNYAKARELFRHVTEEVPDSEVAAEAQFYQGMCYALEGQTVYALQSFQKVLDNYPASPFARKAIGLNSLLYKVHFLPEQSRKHTYRVDPSFLLKNFTYDSANALAIDFDGNLAVSNEGEDAVYFFNEAGEFARKEKYNYKLRSVFFSSAGHLVVGFKERILYFSKYLRVFYKKKKDTQLDQITRVIADSKNTFYVLDGGNDGIMAFTYKEGLDQYDVKDSWPSAMVKSVEDITIDQEENIFFINAAEKSVDKYNLEGKKLGTIPRESNLYKMKSLNKISVDVLGNIYVLDKKLQTIFVFSRNLTFIQEINLNKKVEDVVVNYSGDSFLSIPKTRKLKNCSDYSTNAEVFHYVRNGHEFLKGAAMILLTKRLHLFLFIVYCIASSPCLVSAQQEETNIIPLLQSALNTAVKTFNSQNQPEAILQLNQIIDICQENRASRELSGDELKILSQAYEYRGRAFYNIGETEKAQTDFEDLIKISPRYQLDTTLVSPKVVGLFDKIKYAMVGNLAVFSTPSGSEVFINNSFLSLTPMYSVELMKGEYLLEVKHRGFDVFSERISIQPNTPLEKEVTLVPNTGTCIFFTSPSEVKIYIDGEFVGTTFGQATPENAAIAEEYGLAIESLSAPLKIEYIKPGSHRLELRKECFSTVVQSITVEIKVHEYQPFVLQPSLTSIQVNSAIPASSVYLNDAFKGVTPLTLNDVCTGSYRLMVKKEGKGQWFQQVELKKNEPQIFEASMRPTLTYIGIVNAAEREESLLEKTEEKLLAILSTLKSVNCSAIKKETSDSIARELGLPITRISTFHSTGKEMDLKKKSSILAELGNKLDTDMVLFAYLPEEKIQRYVHLELFSRYHGLSDVFKLAINDQSEINKFIATLDHSPELFKNWTGIVSIDTLFHEGIVTIKVIPGSPAEIAGVKEGDVITRLNNDNIEKNMAFNTLLAKIKEGEKIKLKLTSADNLTKVVGVEVGRTPIELPRNSPNIFYNKAMSELKQKIRVEQKDEMINYYLLNLGFCYMHYNNWQKAIEDAFTHTSLPNQYGISAGTLNYYIAYCYQKLGYADEAQKHYQLAASATGATLESNDGPTVPYMANLKLNNAD